MCSNFAVNFKDLIRYSGSSATDLTEDCLVHQSMILSPIPTHNFFFIIAHSIGGFKFAATKIK